MLYKRMESMGHLSGKLLVILFLTVFADSGRAADDRGSTVPVKGKPALHLKLPAGRPDLLVDSCRWSQALRDGESPGRQSVLNITVRNGGKASAGESQVRIECRRLNPLGRCPAGLRGTTVCPAISPGSQVSLAWPNPSNATWQSGQYEFKVIVDSGKTIGEENESNNEFTFTSFVAPGRKLVGILQYQRGPVSIEINDPRVSKCMNQCTKECGQLVMSLAHELGPSPCGSESNERLKQLKAFLDSLSGCPISHADLGISREIRDARQRISAFESRCAEAVDPCAKRVESLHDDLHWMRNSCRDGDRVKYQSILSSFQRSADQWRQQCSKGASPTLVQEFAQVSDAALSEARSWCEQAWKCSAEIVEVPGIIKKAESCIGRDFFDRFNAANRTLDTVMNACAADAVLWQAKRDLLTGYRSRLDKIREQCTTRSYVDMRCPVIRTVRVSKEASAFVCSVDKEIYVESRGCANEYDEKLCNDYYEKTRVTADKQLICSKSVIIYVGGCMIGAPHEIETHAGR
jgi:hypothetical protein